MPSFSEPSAAGLLVLWAKTSLELVAFINDDRKERAQAVGVSFPSYGFAKLEHADFMKKVHTVLGERAGNFSATYQIPGPNGSSRTAPGYRFPKREACLMAMSYSYELQAKVFDSMTPLEHNNFLAQVQKVQRQRSAEFLADPPDVCGRANRCCRFPKHKAAQKQGKDEYAGNFSVMFAVGSAKQVSLVEVTP